MVKAVVRCPEETRRITYKGKEFLITQNGIKIRIIKNEKIFELSILGEFFIGLETGVCNLIWKF